ncbi:GNAT family N-acetyltransferase [Paenibacillus mesophilus]|uniref:GNAT family N-acetyltransferase n=1 Tax=Paenibacillus mesophilus TaxID=2582849 RepID=UPI00110F3BB1|nr:GNAT family N-acetyltransferase [Paenibacillus mesophilus]TMV48194.1 GNAT family N-acetyltransferase [Paenibacillus mesophilus]
MEITIREITAGDPTSDIRFDSSFTVDSMLVLSVIHRRIGYTVKQIPAYEKSYLDEETEENDDILYSDYIDNPDQIIYLAFVGNQAVGRIQLRRNWNKYAYIEDIAVDRSYRKHGIGRRLIEQAKRWAKAGGMPGIMLETQNNNVRACKFYEKCGFVLGGFDLRLYQGIHAQSDEIALFWYFVFEPQK